MARFRKKPIVIEAVLWNGVTISETPDWIKEALNKEPGTEGNIFRMGNKVEIQTKEGPLTASPGDYIIRGIEGELYPCKPDIFLKTYEPAND